MSRPNPLGFALVMLLLCAALPVFAQTAGSVPGSTAPGNAAPGSTAPGSTAPGNRRGRQQPCWQVAGVSQQTVQQHHQIEENTRSQVESVCANSSLSAQQKQEQVRQIREQGRKQMEGLLSPQQEEALKSCREQRGEQRGGNRGGENHGGGMHHEGGCGEMPAGNHSPNGSKPQQQNESQPEPQ
jgi:hypothetical protein